MQYVIGIAASMIITPTNCCYRDLICLGGLLLTLTFLCDIFFNAVFVTIILAHQRFARDLVELRDDDFEALTNNSVSCALVLSV